MLTTHRHAYGATDHLVWGRLPVRRGLINMGEKQTCITDQTCMDRDTNGFANILKKTHYINVLPSIGGTHMGQC
jgi:hypothetical protein